MICVASVFCMESRNYGDISEISAMTTIRFSVVSRSVTKIADNLLCKSSPFQTNIALSDLFRNASYTIYAPIWLINLTK